jgi:hypothetical protein
MKRVSISLLVGTILFGTALFAGSSISASHNGQPPTALGSSISSGTGYAVAIYHNQGDRTSKNIYGRQFICTLEDGSRSDAADCAMEWCEDWCERGDNPTCRCVEGRTADAESKGWITRADLSTVRRDSRKN